jgi:hypothetical protein
MALLTMGSILSLVCRQPTDNNVITLVDFPVEGAFLPDDGAQAPKHVGDTRNMYLYNRYCLFS